MVELLKKELEELDITTENARELRILVNKLRNRLDQFDERSFGDVICYEIIRDYSKTSSLVGNMKCVGYSDVESEEYNFDKRIISAQFEYKTYEHGEYVYITVSIENIWIENEERSFSPVITFSPKDIDDDFTRWLKVKGKKVGDYFA